MKRNNEVFQDLRTQEEITLNRVNVRWTKEEISLAVMGCQKFGQNFKVKFIKNKIEL